MLARQVDIYSGTVSTLPEVEIGHDKINLLERIQVLKIQPGEHRITAIPGDGKSQSIRAGKNDA